MAHPAVDAVMSAVPGPVIKIESVPAVNDVAPAQEKEATLPEAAIVAVPN